MIRVYLKVPLEFMYTIIIIIHSLGLFTSALADGFSLEFSLMLSFGWSPTVCQLPTPPVPLVIF